MTRMQQSFLNTVKPLMWRLRGLYRPPLDKEDVPAPRSGAAERLSFPSLNWEIRHTQ